MGLGLLLLCLGLEPLSNGGKQWTVYKPEWTLPHFRSLDQLNSRGPALSLKLGGLPPW